MTVQKFVAGAWVAVGAPGFSAGRAYYTSLAFESTGTPFVAYKDGNAGDKATVQKFVAGAWVVVRSCAGTDVVPRFEQGRFATGRLRVASSSTGSMLCVQHVIDRVRSGDW